VSSVDDTAAEPLCPAVPQRVHGASRPRPPCSHVEQLADREGVARALGGGRGGIRADVIDPGDIGVGDEVIDLGSTDRTDEIVTRLRSED
jgi:MOSC domain-containing protein YiiM